MDIAVTTLAVLLFLFNVESARIHDLPSYFPRCKRTDPNLNDCILKATETVKPFLIKGVQELRIPPIEPFQLPQVALQQGTNALNFKAVLKNILVHGLSNYKFTQFDFDVPNLQFFCKATIGALDLEGDYTINGKILVAPIEGSGRFKASIDHSNVTVYQKIEIYEKRGQNYVRPVVTKTTIEVGGPKAHLEGLFNGNPELNRATNSVINDNVDELFKDLKPVLEQVITSVIEDLVFKEIQDRVPYDKLYPK